MFLVLINRDNRFAGIILLKFSVFSNFARVKIISAVHMKCIATANSSHYYSLGSSIDPATL